MKKIFVFIFMIINFCDMSAQHALAYHKNYLKTSLFNFRGWEDGLSYNFPLNNTFGLTFSVSMAFLKKDYIEDKIKNTVNYYTVDDFPNNFPNLIPISSQPFGNYSEIYSSFRKDHGFSFEFYYKKIVNKLLSISFRTGYQSQNSNGQVLIKDYELTIIDPLPTIFNVNEPKLNISYPAHVFFGYQDNQINNGLDLNLLISQRISIGLSGNFRISLNKAGEIYTIGTSIKYSLIK